MTATPSASCPRCGAAAGGNFCARCGAPIGNVACLACGAAVAAGARFCHACGSPLGHSASPGELAARVASSADARSANSGARPSVDVGSGERAKHPSRDSTPWLIAGVLVVLIIAGVLYSANRRAAPDVPSMANAGNAGNAVVGIADNPGAGCVPAGRAPDISNLSPKERFVRLVDRISQYLEKSDTACVITFTPMALGAYANLPAADRDVDAQYHAAMLEAQVGMLDNARALADSIMVESPGNLFAYYIRATTAEFAGDSAGAQAARAAFRAHYDAEIGKNRPEYAEHRPFLAQYRATGGAK